MAEFLVELYVSCADPSSVGFQTARARWAAVDVALAGSPIRLLRSIYIPAEETCFLLYEAASLDVVREAARRAGLSVDHIAEAATQPS